MRTCPDCNGEREVVGLGCGPAECRPMVLPCRTCNATGTISELTARWIADGQKLRTLRMAKDLSLREAARRFDVSPVEWSDAEHGRRDPWPLIERIVDARASEAVSAEAPAAPREDA